MRNLHSFINPLSEIIGSLPPEMRYFGDEEPEWIPAARESFRLLVNNYDPIMTPRQTELINNHNFNLLSIWKRLYKFTINAFDRRILWNFTTSTFPKAHNEQCFCCHTRESTFHILFDCPRNTIVRSLLSQQAVKWKLRPPDWSVDGLSRALNQIGTSKHSIVIMIAALALAWRLRCKQKKELLDDSALEQYALKSWEVSIKDIQSLKEKREERNKATRQRRQNRRKADKARHRRNALFTLSVLQEQIHTSSSLSTET